MRISYLTFLLLFSVLAFLSFVSYYLFSSPISSNAISSSDLAYLTEIEKNLLALEIEHYELKSVLNGLERGTLNSNSPNVLKALRGKSQLYNKFSKSSNTELTGISKKISGNSNIQSEVKIPIVVTNRPTKVSINNQEISPLASTISPKILVIGGTDGSGTRRVVQILTTMGVRIVSEDPETYDIHADLMGGWPPIVKPIIKHFKTLNYNPVQLPSSTLHFTKTSLQRLLQHAEQDSHKPQSYTLAVGGTLKTPKNVKLSSLIQFGFKAPVAMTLLPLWYHIHPDLMFLHVVRDGRDIAFSANQGPVEKFYDAMYDNNNNNNKNHLMGPIRGIQLWSDWNSQIYDWATSIMSNNHNNNNNNNEKKNDSQDTPNTFRYHILHAEDIVPDTTSLANRFITFKKLATWVQSELNDLSICCLAKQESAFMGSHDRTPIKSQSKANPQASLKGRYGKWKAQVDQNPKLGEELHQVGQRGLEVFGYLPLRPEESIDSNSFQCSETTDCSSSQLASESSGSGGGSGSLGDAVAIEIEGCKVYHKVDYRGGGSDLTDVVGSTSEMCCRACRVNKDCAHFTLNTEMGLCFLKSGKGNVIFDESLVSLYSGDLNS